MNVLHKRRYSARPFYLTILAISILTLVSFSPSLTSSTVLNAASLRGRHQAVSQSQNHSAAALGNGYHDCKNVRHVGGQCAFVKAHCADEEAGLLSYLTLYYCTFTHARVLGFIILVAWLGTLFMTIGIAASDFFCVNLSTISQLLGMSDSMAGVTFLALGNGSPDVFSTFAAMNSHSGSLAVGELIGAAGFITAVVAGSVALVRPFKVARKSFVRDVGFFTVAASFSLAFLADGALYPWECVVMVAFYIFYVCTVVVWHWWMKRRRLRRERGSHIPQAHYTLITGEEPEESGIREPEHEAPTAPVWSRRGSLLRRTSTHLSGLSRRVPTWGSQNANENGQQLLEDNDDNDYDDDEDHERWKAQLNDNMRLRRRPIGERRGTLNPIRPSLVGALEFRAVLSSIERSCTLQTTNFAHARRYSEDPNHSILQRSAQVLTIPHCDDDFRFPTGVASSSHRGPGSDLSGSVSRIRAVSMNDALDSSDFQNAHDRSVRDFNPCESPPTTIIREEDRHLLRGRARALADMHSSPQLFVSPPVSAESSRRPSPAPVLRANSADLLAPPPGEHAGPHHKRGDSFSNSSQQIPRPPVLSPRILAQNLPRIIVPEAPSLNSEHSPRSPFPMYTESPFPMSAATSRRSSIHLPRPMVTTNASYGQEMTTDYELTTSYGWWPSSMLPPPGILVSTLFPTLCDWSAKNSSERILCVVAAPSVFLLALTLPVVETSAEDDCATATTATTIDAGTRTLSPREDASRSRSRSSTLTVPRAATGHFRIDSLAAEAFLSDAHANVSSKLSYGTIDNQASAQRALESTEANPTRSGDWNRWLLVIQCFTAPFFIALVVWANSAWPKATLLATMCFYSLLASCISLLLLLLTSSATLPPRWRPMLCFVGFIVSVAWISTIAGEVVGVLKALGVILGISDAILGLTIFAVGNSLGDLVANITVARLYPVMALSSCFGGPMLNILLGIGISGLYMTITHGNHQHERHPHDHLRYKPFQIEVGRTLVISGASLLLTLVGLLIAVPWNGWMMDRKIGWGLIALWTFSTLGNLTVEMSGLNW